MSAGHLASIVQSKRWRQAAALVALLVIAAVVGARPMRAGMAQTNGTVHILNDGDTNTTLTIPVGDVVELHLNTSFVWRVQVSDPLVLRPSAGPLPKDVQGRFVAASSGKVLITAIGDPACLTMLPRCLAPSFEFSATVIVTPGPGPGADTLTVDAGGPYFGTVGQPLSLSASGTDLPADAAFAWDFGDGSQGRGQIVSHTYAAGGLYTATVIVRAARTGQTASATAEVTIDVPPAGKNQVTYPAGWNIVAGPDGMTFPQAFGPLYTFQAGDTAYEVLSSGSPVRGGLGYWAYFPGATTVELNGSGAVSAAVNAPAGQWVMIGNPSGAQPAQVIGADSVLRFDPASNSYVSASTLQPGQGAWARSIRGGTVTISTLPPPPPPSAGN